MNTKEKLTEIIGNVVVNDKGNRIRDVFHPEFVQKIVEDLIKNGVIVAPTADVVPRDEVAKIFEEIEINIFKLETPYQTLHCISSGFIEELKEKYTKGGEG